MESTRIAGCLLGTAIADALGLPYENLSPRRGTLLLGEPDRFRLLPGVGVVSDDTEHAVLAAEAAIAAGGDPDQFQKLLAGRLKVWFLTLPAGLGLATLRACVRLCFGVPPGKSGVRSAGNGAAMRAPILGAMIDDLPLLREFALRSARITHRDERAEQGAALAAFAAYSVRHGPTEPRSFAAAFAAWIGQPNAELIEILERVVESVEKHQATLEFARACGFTAGVSDYICHSIAVALHAWLSHPADYLAAVTAAIRCGGDTDSIAAITGGILGTALGRAGLPPDLMRQLRDWPINQASILRLSETAAHTAPTQNRFASRISAHSPPRYLRILLRNMAFLVIVILHAVRRLLPPY